MTPSAIDITAYTFNATIFVLVSLRVILRQIKHERYYSDDWVMFAALGAIFFNTGVYRLVEIHGSSMQEIATGAFSVDGKPQTNIDDPRRATTGARLILAGRILYTCYIWSMKLCILIYYKRLVARQKEYRLVIISIWTFCAAWMTDVILSLSQCRPLRLLWQVLPEPAKCANARYAILASGIANIVTDVVLIVLPLPMIHRTLMPLKLKIEISAVFAIGIFLVMVSILRLIITMGNLTPQYRFLWGLIECLGETFFANAPIIHSLYRHGRFKFTQRSTPPNRSTTGRMDRQSAQQDRRSDSVGLVSEIPMRNLEEIIPAIPRLAHFANSRYPPNASISSSTLEQHPAISTQSSAENSHLSIDQTTPPSFGILRTVEVMQTFDPAIPHNATMVSPLGGTAYVATNISHHDMKPVPLEPDLSACSTSTTSNSCENI